ncbi:uncharacterized protein LOC128307485 [Anopheles moucheti]|uniref:uncharacterized protein LOC128307485 n=1 Tax=Anopheles moucheti TaxID=186751 RepID=UPI0022F0C353|nr:uncharacterized protein LOC128307485 [Anopheles moucheti]
MTLEEKVNRAAAFTASFVPERDALKVPFYAAEIERVAAEYDGVQQFIENGVAPEERALESQSRAMMEDTIMAVRASLQGLMPLTHPAAATTSQHPAAEIRLPRISLPEFDGDEMKWGAFKDTFEALIHKSTEVLDIQKFHYLRAALKGEAAKLLDSIPLRAKNYPIAWKTLVERHANEYLQKKRHLQAMFNISKVQKESHAALHKLVDEFDNHVKMLHQLGEPTDKWSTILEYVLCLKLPEETQKTWEDHASTVETPDCATLIDFLQRKMRILESR